jgi:glycosyltransferase involved in cell wall biosynthesis
MMNVDKGDTTGMKAPSKISVAVLTYNHSQQVLETLARLSALPERVHLIVVDNGSTDGTPEHIAGHFPNVTLVTARTNLCAAGRNFGVASVSTEYVAFCDDDPWWHSGSPSRAVELMDGAPRVGVLSARVLVDEAGETDATCRLMARSPLDATSLPGPLGKRSRHARRGLRARGRNRRVCRYRYASEHQHTAGSRWRIGMTSRMSMRGDTMPRPPSFLTRTERCWPMFRITSIRF